MTDPLLLPLPGLEAQSLPERFPSPWHGAPVPVALAAREALESCGAFADQTGRRGLLLVQDRSGALSAFCSSEPFHEPEHPEGSALPAADAIAGVTPDEIFERTAAQIPLTAVSGETMTLLDFARLERAKRPAKIARGGGAGLNLTLAHWNRALLGALSTPLVANLLALARARAAGQALTPVASLEWWHGAMPSYDVKFDGMVLSPRTTTKPLVEWLLSGTPFLSDPRADDPVTKALRPEILMERPDFLAVMKPSGLLSVPGTGGLPDAMTLAAEMTGTALTAVHRLDMDTSGILLYAKTPLGLSELMAAFREKRVSKRYRAILEGTVAGDSGRIEFPITTHPLDRLRQIAALGGRDSVTLWRKVAGKNGCTLVDFLPQTGRTHQLRLHAAHPLGLGAPITGDPYYSRAGLLADTPATPLALHAAELVFPDPATGAEIRLEAPEPFAL
ncbi:RluA family pseudouridine synthase [Sutterella sp.]|uniref:RluA family pseudouridine synthase n=1 Tax=Sutterella sp. TaxID=1981025 RepID=UPI0026DFB4D1|nr:RluA family pseudouridine synthase [Sutterella sp.]MDO5532615.1 RluA family pseudouridine synthase [Sutterella sp.]